MWSEYVKTVSPNSSYNLLLYMRVLVLVSVIVSINFGSKTNFISIYQIHPSSFLPDIELFRIGFNFSPTFIFPTIAGIQYWINIHLMFI